MVSVAPACGGDTGREQGEGEVETVRGLIQEVSARSLLEVETLIVKDANGAAWVFQGGGEIISGFTPSHLREHMLQGHAVTVAFHRENGVLIIDDLED